MSGKDRIRLLQGEIARALRAIDEAEENYGRFREDFPPVATERNYDLIILADILTDYYTCVETALVRIAKAFENELEKERWHASLLERMSMDVPAVRPLVVSAEAHRHLHELLRFRHFRRYYFDRKYDRDRMALLERSFQFSLPLVRADLRRFMDFLEELSHRA
jgi:hypothetical protein